MNQSVLVKVKGYPSWPGLILPVDKIPKRLIEDNERKNIVNKKKIITTDTHYCVKFYNDLNYLWLLKNTNGGSGATPVYEFLDDVEKIDALISKESIKRKRNEKLIKSFQIAIQQIQGLLNIDEFVMEGEPVVEEGKKSGDEVVSVEDMPAAAAAAAKSNSKRKLSKDEDAKSKKQKTDNTKEKQTGKKQPAKKKSPKVESVHEETPKKETVKKEAPKKEAVKKETVKKETIKKEAPKKEKKINVYKFGESEIEGTSIHTYQLVNRGEQNLDIWKISKSLDLPSLPKLIDTKLQIQEFMDSLKNHLQKYLIEYIAFTKDTEINEKNKKKKLEELCIFRMAIFANFTNFINDRPLHLFKYLFIQDDELYHYTQTLLNCIDTKDKTYPLFHKIFNTLYT